MLHCARIVTVKCPFCYNPTRVIKTLNRKDSMPLFTFVFPVVYTMLLLDVIENRIIEEAAKCPIFLVS